MPLSACLVLAQLLAGCENVDPQGAPEDDAADQTVDLTQQSLVQQPPRTPNPWLAFLPPGAKPDYTYWSTFKRAQWKTRRPNRPRPNFTSLVAVTESEANNTQATADPVPGFGSAADPAAVVTGSLTSGDVDFFSFTLRAGDVIAAAIPGARILELRTPAGTALVRSEQDVSFTYPPESPLPGDRTAEGNAAFAYVVNTAGTYALSVAGATGTYRMELEVYRPKLDAGGVQTVFLDFDGASVDTAIFDGPAGLRPLSPLRSFLTAFGLTAADENALIDAIVEEVRESLSADLAARGLNPRFALDLRNSRDHAEPTGEANASRVIVGGTVAEFGFQTIGLAQSIDVGNFAVQETAVVLLDILSENLPGIPRASGASMLSLVATAVGNIVAHEAGHYLGDYHTTNENAQANIMDEGGDLENTIGLGADGTFGTADDSDVDFGLDTYSLWEGFVGSEDTLNTVAFATSGQPALGRLTVQPALFCAGRLSVELRDSNLSGAASVTITSSGGDTETLALANTAGVYRGGIDTVVGAVVARDGRLQIQGVASVTVTYQDANNGSGAAATVTAQAAADCQSAVITSVQTRGVSDNGATVSFVSSEPAISRIDFGTSCGALTRNVSGPLATTHTLPLYPLAPNTTYFYAVTATDTVGNSTRADNGGACFSFRTAASTRVFFRDFEAGLGGFTVSGTAADVAWHVTSACAASLPGHSQPNALFFGSDSTCDYVGNSERQAGSATSAPITVNGQSASKLRFNYLLGTWNNDVFDRATVSLSVNGGPFQIVGSNQQDTLPESDTFVPFSLDLYQYLGGAASATVSVRFSFDTLGAGAFSFPGFYVDDVEVVQLAAGSDCTTAAQCNDGLFCNGVEACVTGRCVKARSPCDDRTDCTSDTCNEAQDRCLSAPDLLYCLDTNHCDGQDICQPGVGCIALGNPCPAGLVCSSDQTACVPPCRSSRLHAYFDNEQLNFETTPTVTVNSDAGDHPGTLGTLGVDIDDSGSLTSFPIEALGASTLRLQYWMDVAGFDSGESARVQYCANNCATASNWITLTTVGGTTGWRSYDHALPSSAYTNNLQVRWVSNGSGLNEWVHIDSILVRDTSCTQPLPPPLPRPPVIGAVNVSVDSSNGLARITGTASDPDNDLASVELLLEGAPIAIPFFVTAAGTTSWSVQFYLAPGLYRAAAAAMDREQLRSDDAYAEFVVPERTTQPPPGPVFTANFETGSLAPFTSQGVVTVIASAGDRPGTTGTRGVQIDDAGRIVSPVINAAASTGNLQLQYWMDVNNFDSGESTRVSYCVANCTVETNWVQLTTVGGTTGWRSYTHALPAAAKSSTLQLRWLSNANGTFEWAHIDDIALATQ
jgi:hypothetical protein